MIMNNLMFKIKNILRKLQIFLFLPIIFFLVLIIALIFITKDINAHLTTVLLALIGSAIGISSLCYSASKVCKQESDSIELNIQGNRFLYLTIQLIISVMAKYVADNDENYWIEA